MQWLFPWIISQKSIDLLQKKSGGQVVGIGLTDLPKTGGGGNFPSCHPFSGIPFKVRSSYGPLAYFSDISGKNMQADHNLNGL